MATDKPHIYDPGIYFITFTNCKWIPLFEITNAYDLVYKWFDVLKTLDHHVLGYVIMPNHIHILAGYSGGSKSINTIIGNGKRFMAYDIVERLKELNKADILATLTEQVTVSDRKKGKLHEVFEPSFDIKLCRTLKFIDQKLAYMHANPVSKKWMLATDQRSYEHSSAAYYETGRQGRYEVMNFADWVEDHLVSDYNLGHGHKTELLKNG